MCPRAPAPAASVYRGRACLGKVHRALVAARPSGRMSEHRRQPRRRLPRFDAPPQAPETDLAPSFALLSLSSASSSSMQRAMTRPATGPAIRAKRARSSSPQHAAFAAAEHCASTAKRVHRMAGASFAPGDAAPQVPSRRPHAEAEQPAAAGARPATVWLDLFEARETLGGQWKPLAQRVRRRRQRHAPG